ncbi:MAG: RluA family pseudouridine synthase [Spirochaetaceae bacterium]|jgi:23S rRNA pseudouridine955/2504/2580 synthase|nr:RluA family pseudouridine synthase [Spirochaetaceae bacterium]
MQNRQKTPDPPGAIEILFEDPRFLVLNKRAGLAVQGGEGVGISLDALLGRLYRPKPFLVHRLDKDTSGVMVVAKTREAAAACAALFAQKSALRKRYLAFCGGLIPPGGLIRETLGVRGKNKAAETRYKLLGAGNLPGIAEDTPDPRCSLVILEPATGRMHQIRRHLAGMGHPVLGDGKYGNFKLNRLLQKNLGLKRLLLHALSLYLPPALLGQGREITAPPPDYFLEFLKKAGLEEPGPEIASFHLDMENHFSP